jgi:hypothetical protein
VPAFELGSTGRVDRGAGRERDEAVDEGELAAATAGSGEGRCAAASIGSAFHTCEQRMHLTLRPAACGCFEMS